MKAIAPLSSSVLQLPRYDAMCKAIAECHRIDEAKDLRDKADALRMYTKQIRNREAEVQFAEIKMRAERRCGELLQELAKTGGRAASGEKCSAKPTIPALGLSQMSAHRARKTASVPVAAFEAHLADHRARGEPVTSSSVRRIGQSPRTKADEAQRALSAIEILSDLSVTPEQFANHMAGEKRTRLMLSLTSALPWLTSVARHLSETLSGKLQRT